MNGKTILKILQKQGWQLIRVRGSHHCLRNDSLNKNITVPVHGKKDLKPKTLKSIEKSTGIVFGK